MGKASCQRWGWVLFQVFLPLTMKEDPCHVSMPSKQKNWTNNNVQLSHKQPGSQVLMAYNTLKGTVIVTVEMVQLAVCTALAHLLKATMHCDNFNLLTTDDAFWHRQTLAACYQLAQSVLKLGSVLAERVGQGEVGGCTPLGDSAWQLLQLAVERPWSMPCWWANCLLSYTNGSRKCSFHLVETPFLAFQAAFSPEEHSLVRGP